MSPRFGNRQMEIYRAGLDGVLPRLPADFATTAATLPPWVLSYVAGGAGDERTQRVACAADAALRRRGRR